VVEVTVETEEFIFYETANRDSGKAPSTDECGETEQREMALRKL